MKKKVNSLNSHSKVIITCLTCKKDFCQRPSNHLKWHGYPVWYKGDIAKKAWACFPIRNFFFPRNPAYAESKGGQKVLKTEALNMKQMDIMWLMAKIRFLNFWKIIIMAILKNTIPKTNSCKSLHLQTKPSENKTGPPPQKMAKPFPKCKTFAQVFVNTIRRLQNIFDSKKYVITDIWERDYDAGGTKSLINIIKTCNLIFFPWMSCLSQISPRKGANFL